MHTFQLLSPQSTFFQISWESPGCFLANTELSLCSLFNQEGVALEGSHGFYFLTSLFRFKSWTLTLILFSSTLITLVFWGIPVSVIYAFLVGWPLLYLQVHHCAQFSPFVDNGPVALTIVWWSHVFIFEIHLILNITYFFLRSCTSLRYLCLVWNTISITQNNISVLYFTEFPLGYQRASTVRKSLLNDGITFQKL